MRVVVTAMSCPKGELDRNLHTHLDALRTASDNDAELVVCPEMSLTGYPDPVAQPDHLIAIDHEAVVALVHATATTGVACCFGIAERTETGAARITQILAVDGRAAAVQRKRHLGDDEDAYTAATGCEVAMVAGRTFGMTICAEGGVDFPFDEAVAAGADAILFCAAPGLYGRRTDEASWREGYEWWRSKLLVEARGHAKRLGVPILLSGQSGPTVDEDFPGGAALVDADGTIVDELPDWRPGALTIDLA